jgi:hypothetical protein
VRTKRGARAVAAALLGLTVALPARAERRPVPPGPTIFALLADSRLLAARLSTGGRLKPRQRSLYTWLLYRWQTALELAAGTLAETCAQTTIASKGRSGTDARPPLPFMIPVVVS